MTPETREAIESFVNSEAIAEETLYLETFRARAYPAYAERGFTFPEAVMAYRLSSIDRELTFIKLAVRALDDSGDCPE